MRILLVNYEYPPIGAGAANAAWHIARELKHLGVTVDVLTARYASLKGRTNEDGVTVHRIPSLRRYRDKSSIVEMASFLISASLYLPRLVRQRSYDAAIVFFSLPCGPLGLLGDVVGHVPYVVSLRGGDVPGSEPGLKTLQRILAPARRMVLKKAQAVVANSVGLKRQSERVDPYPVQVIPNGIDTDFFQPCDHANGIFRFLFVGRFQPQKNLFFLLEAMHHLAHQSQTPFEIHLVGDGPLRGNLEQDAHRLGLHGKIVWHGWCDRPTLRGIYQHADCTLNPSLYEGMPNVLLESMACGVPVIASDVMGNNEVVRDAHTGYLFPLDEQDAFIRAMRNVLEDRGHARRLGQNARATVTGEFTWAKTAYRYLELFRGSAQHAV